MASSRTAPERKTRICLRYNSYDGCNKVCCRDFHICKQFVAGFCRFGERCHYSHTFDEIVTQENIKRLHLEELNEDEMMTLMRLSAPFVCDDYQTGVCEHQQNCPNLHICKGYVLNNKRYCMTIDEAISCELCHDLDSPHTKYILGKYNLIHAPVNIILRSILVKTKEFKNSTSGGQNRTGESGRKTKSENSKRGRGRTKQKDVSTVRQTGKQRTTFDIIDDLTAAICIDNILGKCQRRERCLQHHCSLPYQWALSFNNKLHIFRVDVNENIERAFCDITRQKNSNTTVQAKFHNEQMIDASVVIHFQSLYADLIFKSGVTGQCKVHRLSTPSSVTIGQNIDFATHWIWYWRDNDVWRPYGNSLVTDEANNETIETSYETARNISYNFIADSYMYQLCFMNMKQTNLVTDTKRDVLRLPVFVSRGEVKIKIASLTAKLTTLTLTPAATGRSFTLPKFWDPMPPDEDFIQVALSPSCKAYMYVEGLFRKTMPADDEIIVSIERLQHPHFWQKYQSAKEHMKSKGIPDFEKSLFHGTEKDSVQKICKQNFDFRVSGKNNTLFGQGSYFAVKASYSDKFSPSDEEGLKYMFVAKVLVGRFTKGNSSYRRPPEINPYDPNSDLYDSCVDNETRPSKFVIFDRDQSYPEYLITYMSMKGMLGHHGDNQSASSGKPRPMMSQHSLPITTQSYIGSQLREQSSSSPQNNYVSGCHGDSQSASSSRPMSVEEMLDRYGDSKSPSSSKPMSSRDVLDHHGDSQSTSSSRPMSSRDVLDHHGDSQSASSSRPMSSRDVLDRHDDNQKPSRISQQPLRTTTTQSSIVSELRDQSSSTQDSDYDEWVLLNPTSTSSSSSLYGVTSWHRNNPVINQYPFQSDSEYPFPVSSSNSGSLSTSRSQDPSSNSSASRNSSSRSTSQYGNSSSSSGPRPTPQYQRPSSNTRTLRPTGNAFTRAIKEDKCVIM